MADATNPGFFGSRLLVVEHLAAHQWDLLNGEQACDLGEKWPLAGLRGGARELGSEEDQPGRNQGHQSKRTLNQRSANFSVKGQMINTSCFAGRIFFFVLFLQTFKKVKTFLTAQVIRN